MITCSIDKLCFDEMFLELQKVVPQDSVAFVRDETARLSEECANQLSRRRGDKGSLKKDISSVLMPEPKEVFRGSQAAGKNMRWLYATPFSLYGVDPSQDRSFDTVQSLKGAYYSGLKNPPAERIATLGIRKTSLRVTKHGHELTHQVVKQFKRILAGRSTYDQLVRQLASHIGRLEASFAQTAQLLRGRAKVKPYVARHFPSQTNIHQEAGLSNPQSPGMTFGSFAPGVDNYEEYIETALAVRVAKMEQRWSLIVGGYCKEMTASLPPKRMAEITMAE